MNRGELEWARFAAQHPGGFGGLYIEHPTNETSRLVVWLRDTTQRHLILEALTPHVSSVPYQTSEGLAGARIARAAWSYDELVLWYRYLVPRIEGLTSLDFDESNNRLRFGVWTNKLKAAQKRLRELAVPKNLVTLVAEDPQPLTERGAAK